MLAVQPGLRGTCKTSPCRMFRAHIEMWLYKANLILFPVLCCTRSPSIAVHHHEFLYSECAVMMYWVAQSPDAAANADDEPTARHWCSFWIQFWSSHIHAGLRETPPNQTASSSFPSGPPTLLTSHKYRSHCLVYRELWETDSNGI